LTKKAFLTYILKDQHLNPNDYAQYIKSGIKVSRGLEGFVSSFEGFSLDLNMKDLKDQERDV